MTEDNPFIQAKSLRSDMISQKITDVSSDIAKYASDSRKPIFVCMSIAHGPNLELVNGIQSNLENAGVRFLHFDGGFNKQFIEKPRLDQGYFTFDNNPALDPNFDAPFIISRGLKQVSGAEVVDGLFVVFEPSSAVLDGQKNISGKLNLESRWKDSETDEIFEIQNCRILNLKPVNEQQNELVKYINCDDSQRLFLIDLHEIVPEHLWRSITKVRFASLVGEQHKAAPEWSPFRLGLRSKQLGILPASVDIWDAPNYNEYYGGWIYRSHDHDGYYLWNNQTGWNHMFDNDYD